ncbi:MAG: DeoR/GlpR family DNA-binding transcription regulator [Aerococcaceae bacterium]|nr:DeoR/GlpR family DNA-binding transcription regulator [Aerococcaceae bacterium]
MKRSTSDIKWRREQILTLLKEAPNENLSVEALAAQLNVSEMTIRRDLKILDDMGKVIRQHGSATLGEQPHFEGDTHNNPLETLKYTIAKKAASFVKQHMTLYMNTSSTALQCVDFLKELPLTIVTNNLLMSQKEMHPASTIILSGGEIRFPKAALVGDLALRSLTDIHSDIAILGCSGISAEKGITTGNFHEANVNRLMIQNAQSLVIVVADYRKIGTNANFVVTNLDAIDILITDVYADEQMIRDIEAKGVTVLQVSNLYT